MCTECEEKVNQSFSSLSTIDENVVARQINLNDFAGSEPVEDTDEETQPIAAQRKSGARSGPVRQPSSRLWRPAPGSINRNGGRSGGQPLPPDTRQFMESRFGHDFGQVRLHTDAFGGFGGDLCARAYTVGTDIASGPGSMLQRHQQDGRPLAHELRM
jgi:hypothetical protein